MVLFLDRLSSFHSPGGDGVQWGNASSVVSRFVLAPVKYQGLVTRLD